MLKFNVRVYGILITEEGDLLLSDEYDFGFPHTKFPGGGLEYGEGTRECLMREFIEECNLKIEVLDHFYTTDFFQKSAFTHLVMYVLHISGILSLINSGSLTNS